MIGSVSARAEIVVQDTRPLKSNRENLNLTCTSWAIKVEVDYSSELLDHRQAIY